VQIRTKTKLTPCWTLDRKSRRTVQPARLVTPERFLSLAQVGLGLVMALVHLSAASGDDAPPDQVLKRLGVKRSASNYILAAEATVKNKLNEARIVYRRLSEAVKRQRELERYAHLNRQEVRQLAAERLELNQQLVAAGANLSVQQHNQLVAMINARSDRMRELDAEMPDAQTLRQADERVVQGREAFLGAVLDLRKTVDEIAQKYDSLAKDDQLQKAIAASDSRSKSPPKLGPSPEFKNNLKQLQNLEKLVLTDTVPVVRKGGVYEVQVTLNDKLTIPFVYDTGAAFLTVSADVAARLGLEIAENDAIIRLEVADGTVIEARRKTIPSVRLGRFTINDVECAVMPPDKGKAQPLLGQSFLHNFRVSGSPASGQLVLSRIGDQDAPPKRAESSKATKKSRRGR
jgi:clan AA aspartic protease (TIGR02281 family)